MDNMHNISIMQKNAITSFNLLPFDEIIFLKKYNVILLEKRRMIGKK